MRRVLLTGASGGIGTRLRTLLKPHYPELVLSDLKPPPELRPDEEFIQADLAKPEEIEKAAKGVEGIVHLGGFSVEGPWETILEANIIGCYNLFEAARKNGVKRVVFASSNHAVGFYPRNRTIGPDVTPLPDSRYGVSKVFGEALGALYAYKHGLGVLSIRIGNFGEKPIDERRLSIWLKPEDLVKLVRIGFETPNLVYEVVYGASDNKRAWWDNRNALRLDYRPRHKSEDFAKAVIAREPPRDPNDPTEIYQGGAFVTAEAAVHRKHIQGR